MLKARVFAPEAPQKMLTDRQWLEVVAQPFLDDHRVLYWNHDPATHTFSGFSVLLDGGREVTVKLSDRSL